MTETVRLTPRSDNVALVAWQFLGQPFHEWPHWVQASCSLHKDSEGRLELRHRRQSGTQIVYLDEWLVRDLDGGVCYYTDSELWGSFAIAR